MATKDPAYLKRWREARIVKAMLEDVYREGAGEVVDDSDTRKAISCRAAQLWKQGQTALVRR